MTQLNHQLDTATRSGRDRPIIYPVLGGAKDLGFVRLSGNGLGNSFYSYFHAFVLANQCNGQLIFPAWMSLKSGPIRRGDASKRLYIGLFEPQDDEMAGLMKYVLLRKALFRPNVITIGDAERVTVDAARLNLVNCKEFIFRGLYEHKDLIRKRLVAMTRKSLPDGFGWGSSPYAAIHVRLGDFATTTDIAAINGGASNKRVPMSWYVHIIKRIKQSSPDRPILIVSDGQEAELAELINAGARLLRTGSDIGDLLSLASASLLVGSNSTFSRWASFLGGMPSIWTARLKRDETPSRDDRNMYYIPVGADGALSSFPT
ncbi:hypothetical protein IC762_12805 [Bradyrhizobium genosp. L]|uniref:hypothetical protein n=1 Tax=Bradyrhizobium genosp. L TaxID=83637 RepID=UPI0018A2F753|nr:hypothetical protein [Bradyrhizobium genosp. L]QPF87117.1 hypothetical protein IC762_12805 [Bradyrhizobium genosp. L]